MTNRERVDAIMHYQPYDRMPVVAFGYWGETLRKWQAEGHVSEEEAAHYWDNNEYDFQNLIHLILRPVFPGIEVEPFEIKFDENKKYADFALCKNKIVIEAKWIDTTSKKEAVLKTIKGLKDFYSRNGNIECLIFLILYDTSLNIDKSKIESEYSNEYSGKPIFIRLFENK